MKTRTNELKVNFVIFVCESFCVLLICNHVLVVLFTAKRFVTKFTVFFLLFCFKPLYNHILARCSYIPVCFSQQKKIDKIKM